MNRNPDECVTTAQRVQWLRSEADDMERDLSPQENPHEFCMPRLMASTGRDLARRMERRAEHDQREAA